MNRHTVGLSDRTLSFTLAVKELMCKHSVLSTVTEC